MNQNKYAGPITHNKAIKAKLKKFYDLVIKHPKLMEAFSMLINAITYAHPSSIIFVFGPTGVGKTTLLERIYNHLLEQHSQEMAENPGYIPVILYPAIAADSGIFNWKDYYIRALKAAGEPMIESKANKDVADLRRELRNMHVSYRNMSTVEYRKAYELCLVNRKPEAVIIDEAQHFRKLPSGRRLLDQMDTIKSLADTTETKHVLVGTYELLKLADLSGQLNRRTIYIHFPRYHYEGKSDYIDFKGAIHTFEGKMDLAEQPNLLSHSEYLYRYSAGCVGILKQWILRAYARALEDGSKTILIRHLEKSAFRSAIFHKIVSEIKDGENAFTVDKDKEISSLLGMIPSSTTPPKVDQENPNPFKRKPSRDLVGA